MGLDLFLVEWKRIHLKIISIKLKWGESEIVFICICL